MHGSLRPSSLESRGFTLVEVIIALALISVTLVVMIQGISTALTTSDKARDRTMLLNLAQGQLEDIMKQSYQELPAAYATITPVPEGYSIAIAVSTPVAYTFPSATPAPEVVQRVTVTVTGYYGALSVEGFKVRQ